MKRHLWSCGVLPVLFLVTALCAFLPLPAAGICGVGCAVLGCAASVFVVRNTVRWEKKAIQSARKAAELAKGNLSSDRDNPFSELSYQIRRCVNTTAALLDQISRGNLTVTPTGDFPGELAHLDASVGKLISVLNNVIGELGKQCEDASQRITQITSGTQSVLQGSIRLTGQVSGFSANAQSLEKAAIQSQEKAKQAAEFSSSALKSLEQAKGHFDQAAGTVSDTEKSARDLIRAAKETEETAAQINVLAFRASVEAATAGGEGFHAAAGQLRKLAEQCAQAARKEAVLAEETARGAKTGTDFLQLSADRWAQAAGEIRQAEEQAGQAASSLTEAKGMADRLNQGIRQTADFGKNLRGDAEKGAASCRALSQHVHSISTVIHRFRLSELEKQGPSPIPPASKTGKVLPGSSIMYTEEQS